MLVDALINFGVKNQVPQVSFKILVGDLILLHNFGSDMNLFGYYLSSDLIIFGSSFNIQELTVLLVTGFINFGVTNQAPQGSFNFVVEDSMLVLSYEFDDIIFCELLDSYEALSYYGAQEFTLHSPKASLPLVTCSSPHRTSKEEDILHLLGHLLLKIGADFTTHGFLFNSETYQFLECSTHGSNPQEPLLFLQMISAALHGSSFHRAVV